MSIDGKWNVVVSSPMGPQKSEVIFQAEGGKLTGTAESGSVEIADGKIDGDKATWKISVKTPMPMTLEFSGSVAGDNLSGSVKAGMFGSFPFTGTRA